MKMYTTVDITNICIAVLQTISLKNVIHVDDTITSMPLWRFI